MRTGAGAVRRSLRNYGLLFRDDDIAGAGDAGGLHVAQNVGFQGADFEVAVDCPSPVGHALGEGEMQFGGFVVTG